MADFLLDRIRFKWVSGWVSGTVYTKDNVLYYKGRVYVCLVGHTAGADIRTDISKWELMFDGQEWKGNWAANTVYGIGNLVKYNGYIYRCVSNHTSVILDNLGLPNDLAHWTLLATTYDWKNIWSAGFNYNLGDVVRYNGIVYICSTTHTSAVSAALGLEADQANWNVVVTSDYWSTDWTISTRYLVDDLVRYGAKVYRCITGHTSAATIALGLEPDQAKWEIVISGLEYKTDWVGSVRYKVNDIVKVDATLYICTIAHESTIFENNIANWQVWMPGIGYEEIWTNNTNYNLGDIVIYGGYTYVAIQPNINSEPSATGFQKGVGAWDLLNTAYKVTGEWNVGTQYKTGDVARNGGYLYIALADNLAAYPDTSIASWRIVIPGYKFRAEWNDNETYYPGEIVTYLGTAYTCITRHISTASDSRPDLDQEYDQEDFWAYVSKGSVNNVLAQAGDTRVYNSEIARLGIGLPGQVIKVDANLPTFNNFGVSEKVYFVSTKGTDAAGFGLTANAAFRSVKYACDYIAANTTERAPATVYITTGLYEEQTPISVPATVALVGDELRSTIIQAATGYTSNDMFLVRNGSGIRNMTLQGLTGVLGSPNQYLTQRPTGGAYVSLDPGTGPTDTTAWITNKSPYVQNVTTFGTACIGMKIDGNVHNGGNRSIVANDFTQVIDDGIGVWATNGGLTELVSVFTYFNYIGYLAENGGKMRATNGNNSYGTYGSVAEGVTVGEDPILANIDNKSKEAEVGIVHNNGNEIMAIAYSNAGQTYTNATFTVAGSGANASLTMSDFRDGAVSNVKVATLGDSSIPGGLNYTSIVGGAQTGDTTSITLDNGDLQTDAAKYQGQLLFIISGAGIGQYGVIDTYTPGTKVATIVKHSDGTSGWDRISDNYAVATELNLTTRYQIEPRLVFSAPASGVRAIGRAVVERSRITRVNIYNPGSGYTTTPTITITDNEATVDAQFDISIQDGVLGLPTYANRGVGYIRSTATITGDGSAENRQTGVDIKISNLARLPGPGDNVSINGIEEVVYKLTRITDVSGTEPNLSATIRLYPSIGQEESPGDNELITIRQNYSQVRLTGHDFLDIGSGNVNSTRYPQLYLDGVDSLNTPQQQNEVQENGGGRVFYTSTDQDGNFRTGELFEVEQSTGIVTIDASQFDLTGLTQLSLGGIQVGGSAVVIKEFSKDGTFIANSNNIVPTQAAIIKYLNSRISGGSANATTNKLTAGQIIVQLSTISSAGTEINIPVPVNFTGGITGGDMLAMQLFAHRSKR
jgi:hypothetical protein